MICIDGSQGEGGGQVLRSALGLSLVTGRPFEIRHIRARRPRPGLRRQHLMAVRAAATIGTARVSGDHLGSTRLRFEPAEVTPGQYHFAIGTAGSTTLVLQTVLPALILAGGPSRLRLEGGTHNPGAPPFDFIALTFLPLLERMGPRVAARLRHAGFYPAGGGQLEVDVTPADGPLRPLTLLDRGRLRALRGVALVTGLPRSIAQRELAVLGRELGVDAAALEIAEPPQARGPGNVVLVEVQCSALTEVFTAFGRRGLPAERVAQDVCGAVRAYLDSPAACDEHLSDQLLIPLALSGGGALRTTTLSSHAATNMEVIRKFLDVEFEVTAADGCTIRVRT